MNCHNKYRININSDCSLFLRGETLKSRSSDRLSVYESYCQFAVHNYFILKESDLPGRMKIKNCAALIYAKEILQKLKNQDIQTDSRCSFDEQFYNELAAELSGNKNIPADSDLVIINLKQTSELLRNSALIENINGHAKPSKKDVASATFFNRLIEAFWNGVAWSDIFPSSPELADRIHQKRKILSELLLENSLDFKGEELAGDFFDLSGLSSRDNNFSISFFEFYIVNWLENFGIIEVEKKAQGDVLRIDEYGINIVNSLLK